MTEFVTDRHLGGYVKNGDSATFYPELWTWLVEEYQVRSVLDVGCGEGHAIDYFASLGISARGIDGVDQGRTDILRWDYEDGPMTTMPAPRMAEGVYGADLIWSCEFVEHVEERYVPNFLATFACADLVLMTHAQPGQPGWHHVNLHQSPYWVGAMASIGYQYDDVLTVATRELARSNTDVNNHYVRSGLAFKRYE